MADIDDPRARREARGSLLRIPRGVRPIRVRAGLARLLAGEAAYAAKVARAARRAGGRDKGAPGTATS